MQAKYKNFMEIPKKSVEFICNFHNIQLHSSDRNSRSNLSSKRPCLAERSAALKCSIHLQHKHSYLEDRAGYYNIEIHLRMKHGLRFLRLLSYYDHGIECLLHTKLGIHSILSTQRKLNVNMKWINEQADQSSTSCNPIIHLFKSCKRSFNFVA